MATTYYIDHDNGSNTNNGTSKTTAWKSHPYMQTGTACTTSGSGPSYPTHVAGDQFIFKGGVTWPVGCFQMSIPKGGTSGNIDYYGVDKTWFSGTTWTRPLFNLQQNIPAGNHVIVVTSAFPGFTTFDNIEIANQGLSLGTFASDDAFNFNNVSGSMPSVTIQNVYIHDWITNTDVSTKPSNYIWPYSAGAIYDGHNRITVDTVTISGANSWVFNGATKVTGGYSGGCVNCGEVKNSLFHDTGAACFSVFNCHDNEFYNIAQTRYDLCPCRPHAQVIEDDRPSGTSPGGNKVYNNLIHDCTPGNVTIYQPYNSFIYNNVLWNNFNEQILLTTPASDSSGQIGYVLNNTIDCTNTSSATCIGMDSKASGLGTLILKNNFWISNVANPTCFNSGTCKNIATITTVGTGGNNVLLTGSAAAAQGFNISRKYIPTNVTNSTVGAGQDLHVSPGCTGGLAQLCTDPESAPWYGSTGVARPNGGWDSGAFQFPTGNTTPPTVALTSPPAGTVSGTQTLTLTCTPVSPATISSVKFQIDGTDFGAAGSSSPYSLTWDTTTASNANHTIAAFCVDSGALSNSVSEVVTVSNNMPGCFVSSNNWSTSQSFATQSGQFTATFTVKPLADNLDDVVGFSASTAGAFVDLAAIVRFNGLGNIDVRNGGSYQAVNTVAYTSGTVYSFSATIDIPHHTYSVQLTSPSNTTLATNYAFRTEQSLVGSLSVVNMEGSATPNTAQFCNLVIVNSIPPGPGGSNNLGPAKNFTATVF